MKLSTSQFRAHWAALSNSNRIGLVAAAVLFSWLIVVLVLAAFVSWLWGLLFSALRDSTVDEPICYPCPPPRRR